MSMHIDDHPRTGKFRPKFRRPTARCAALRTLQARVVANDPLVQKSQKNSETNQHVTNPETGNFRLSEKPTPFVWNAVNPVTWRLVDPDGDQVLVPRSHGQWPAFKTPKAMAWVFDVGDGQSVDWRVRVRVRGGWQAFGSVGDLDTAKQIAHRALRDDRDHTNSPRGG